MPFQIKRVYDHPEKSDGCRILIDRLWPRGISKEELQLDEWMKELAPSTELRKWFDHDSEKFEEFQEKYHRELNEKTKLIKKLLDIAEEQNVTLVYAAKDQEHNNAVVLKQYLADEM